MLLALHGDIASQEVDAVVNPANSALIMGGGVAGALKRAGGWEIEDEAVRKAPVPVGQAVATSGGKLRARYVIHSPTMASPAMRTNVNAVRAATHAALKAADDLHLTTIAFPGMGTGVGGVKPMEAAAAMVDEIKKFIDGGTCLKEIRLVCLEDELLKAFDQALSGISAG